MLAGLLPLSSLLLMLFLFGPPPVLASWVTQETPSFVLGEISIEPPITNAGEPVSLLVRVSNVGETEGEYEVPVLVDKVTEAKVVGQLPPGGGQTHFIPIVRTEAKSYFVQVGEQILSFSVRPASFAVSTLELFPAVVGSGQAVEISGTVINTGGAPGIHRLPLLVDGVLEDEWSGLLPPGATASFLFTVRRNGPGIYAFSVGEKIGGFTVLGLLAKVELPDSVGIVPQTTTAVDDLGRQARVMGDRVILRQGTEGILAVELPVDLERGRSLRTMRDLASDVNLAQGILTLPVANEGGGGGSAELVVDLPPWVSGGEVVTVQATNPRLRLHGIPVHMSLADPALGIVQLDLELELNDASLGATTEVLGRKELSQQAWEGFDAEAEKSGATVADVALVLEMANGGPEEKTMTGAGEIRFALGAAWVAKYGLPSSVMVGAELGPGVYELLMAKHTGRDTQERETFSTTLPPGLTSLALLALVPRPAEGVILVRQMTLKPPAAVPGEAVHVRTLIANQGREFLAAPISFRINGRLVRSRTVFLDPGQERSVSFVTSFSRPGTYTIQVGEQKVPLGVAPPLDPLVVRLQELQVVPNEAPEDSPVQLSVQVINTGDQRGRAHPLIRINGVLAQGLPVVLAPGDGQQVGATLVQRRPGRYQVSVDALEVLWTVVPPPSPATFSVSKLQVMPSIVDPGEAANVSFTVTNMGGTSGTFLAEMRVGDESQVVGVFPVSAHRTVPVKTELILYTAGRHTLTLVEETAFLVVQDAKRTTFRVTSLMVTPHELTLKDVVTVSVLVTNEESVVGVDEVTLKVDDKVVNTERLWLGKEVSRGLVFTVEPASGGVHEVDVNGLRGQFTVVGGFRWGLVLGMIGGLLLLGGTATAALRLHRLGRIPIS